MSLPRYSDYKNSGIVWVGKLPAHWDSLRTKTLFELMKRPPRDGDGVVTAFRDGEVTLRTNRRTDGFTNSLQEIGYQGVRRGDLVIHAMDAFAGAIGVSDSDGKSTPVYSVCKPRPGLSDSGYYGRLLRHMALSGFIESLAKGIRERSTEFRWAEAGNVYLPVPPVTEQAAIAKFLDRETARIDALIAEQEKLIALLAEKRQATISHAVTKGLDPNAPMKDSGVAWLGEVPAHWEMKRVKDCGCEVVDCKNRTPEPHDDGDYFVVRTSCVKDGQFILEPGYWTDEANFIEWTAKGRPRGGDVLFTREAPTGEACLAPEGLDFCLGQRMMYIRPPKQVLLSEFLLYSIYGGLARERISEKSKGSTVGHLRVGEVSELPLLLPPLDEQKALIEFVGNELSKLQALAGEAGRAIALMTERRSSLIAAAVTGQIDVRSA
jgi:type I restriction enzyme S subunit